MLVRAVTRSESKIRVRLIALTSWFCQVVTSTFNMRVTLNNVPGYSYTGKDRFLVLSNHMSYLDVAVLGTVIPSVYITSREVEETPFLGHMSRAARCLFVERRSRKTLLGDIDRIAATLNDGFNVTLFPEGSTTNGEEFLGWKSSLLESAMRSRCRVIPVCLRYDAIDGRPFGPANRDVVAWYGDMTFFPHLLRLLTVESIDVSLTPKHRLALRARRSRKLLAAEARDLIAGTFFDERVPEVRRPPAPAS